MPPFGRVTHIHEQFAFLYLRRVSREEGLFALRPYNSDVCLIVVDLICFGIFLPMAELSGLSHSVSEHFPDSLKESV